jgi:hypothetical protein
MFDDFALARAIHVLALVHWIGGLSAVTTIVLPRAGALADAKDAVAAFEAFTPHGHGGSLSNQSHVTSNRVSDATTRILKISDQRPAREIGRLRPIRPSQTHRPLTIRITA